MFEGTNIVRDTIKDIVSVPKSNILISHQHLKDTSKVCVRRMVPDIFSGAQ